MPVGKGERIGCRRGNDKLGGIVGRLLTKEVNTTGKTAHTLLRISALLNLPLRRLKPVTSHIGGGQGKIYRRKEKIIFGK